MEELMVSSNVGLSVLDSYIQVHRILKQLQDVRQSILQKVLS